MLGERFIGRDLAKIVDASLVEIDCDATTAQDRPLPFASSALADLKMRGHVLDGAEQLEVERAHSDEHTMAPGIVEGQRGNTLLNNGGAAAVLNLIEQRTALALAAQQGPSDRRPSKHRRISEMEYVMKPVAVRIIGVVS